MRSSYLLASLVIPFLMSACTSTPAVNQSAINVKDAEKWLNQYCSTFNPQKMSANELNGEVVMRSNTREFKGQYPASIRYEKNGTFLMEVTNILGGTMMRMTGTASGIEILVPSKPQFNRKNVTNYMGLELPVLAQLLRGDLPCPSERSKLQVEGSTIVIPTRSWKWIFERSTAEEGLIPVRVRLVSKEQTIALTIEEWNREERFAKKVLVKTVDGELKWTWRSRDLK